ncbi:hypothetical protein [Vibrio sp.]|uniref:hypothetical protein n=1 Tax=Vibrio sp. TaxID=678 RepID=UPI003D0CAA84
MNKLTKITAGMLLFTTSLVLPFQAMAKHQDKHFYKHHGHSKHWKKHHTKVVVIEKRSRPEHRHYHHSRLPELAAFAVIAGITYAVVDNHFYKQQGDNYVYVENPRH